MNVLHCGKKLLRYAKVIIYYVMRNYYVMRRNTRQFSIHIESAGSNCKHTILHTSITQVARTRIVVPIRQYRRANV